MRVTVVGAGRVGLTTALSLAYSGNEVTCVDMCQDLLDAIRRDQPTFYEPGVAELLRQTNVQFSYPLTPESASARVLMVAVGTPPLADGRADLSAVESVASDVASLLPNGGNTVFTIKSTVPPGTSRRIQNLIDDSLVASNAKVTVAANPEFLRGSTSLMDTLCPDRIVLGVSDAESKDALLELYQPIIDQTFPLPAQLARPVGIRHVPVVTTTPLNAELIKDVSNAFLATKLSFVNEVAGLAEAVGADIVEVIAGVALDPRLGSGYMGAGVGWGGPCFAKDTSALLRLAEDYNYDMPILRSAVAVNDRQRRSVVEKLQRALGSLQDKSIGLLGLAYKAGTDETIDSPSLAVASVLDAAGARVRAFDPMAEETAKRRYPHLDIDYAGTALEAARGCDAIVILCEWQEFKELPLTQVASVMNGRLLLDAKNFLDREKVEESGLVYLGMGR